MQLAADDVQSLVIPGCGHYCLEEAPGDVVAALTAFSEEVRAGFRPLRADAAIQMVGTPHGSPAARPACGTSRT
jgi:hypothetical protein